MTPSEHEVTGPHAGQPILPAGAPLSGAKAVLVLQQGRGGNPTDMLALGQQFGLEDLALLAPTAAGGTWYPYSFLAPIERNEPWLSSALASVGAAVAEATRAGIPPDHVALLGFSQGACLTLEFVARRPRRYGAVLAFIGGLIGPPGTSWTVAPALAGTPVLLSEANPDPHVPLERAEETATVLSEAGADVTLRVHAGHPHTVHTGDFDTARELLRQLLV